MHESWRILSLAALATCIASPALAQQRPASPAPPPAATAQPKDQGQKPVTWEGLPRMQLEQMFAGPLQDTVVQRWRDPQTGIVCYLYLPFTVQHTPPTATGAVQYGANSIGSITCLEPAAALKMTGQQPAPPPAAAARKPAPQPQHPAARAPAPGEAPAQQ